MYLPCWFLNCSFSVNHLIFKSLIPPQICTLSTINLLQYLPSVFAASTAGTIHTLYIIYSYIGITPGGFMLWRTAYSATQRRRAKVFRPATAAAHITYDRHISKRQSLNAIFTRGNPNIGINKCPACRSDQRGWWQLGQGGWGGGRRHFHQSLSLVYFQFFLTSK